ncbi:MAG: hypothetical protein KGS10_04360 [Chloroflexi bacterium]|nr:hypothetical protein [Chloroflexota bacterium]
MILPQHLDLAPHEDLVTRRRTIAALPIDPDWRRVFAEMGSDLTVDEWSAMTGYAVEAISAAIALAGLRVRRLSTGLGGRREGSRGT